MIFNINLLSYDGHTDTNDFMNSVVSHYLLPYIMHPARVTNNSFAVIDNIFSIVTDFDTISGNMINQICRSLCTVVDFEKKIILKIKTLHFINMIISVFKWKFC